MREKMEKPMARKPAKPPLQLGRAVKAPRSPDEARLDRVPNPHTGTSYFVRFTAPEAVKRTK